VSDLIVIESPFGVVALSRDDLQKALAAAAEIRASVAPANSTHAAATCESVGAHEPWLTAQQCEAATGVPASWFAEGARRGAIPFIRAGHYVRFRLSDLKDALSQRPNDARTRNARVRAPQPVDSSHSSGRTPKNVASNVAPLRKNGAGGEPGAHQ
jgi:hypothetical protein